MRALATVFLILSVCIVMSATGGSAVAADSFAEAAAYPAGWYLPRLNEVRLGASSHGIGNPERDTVAIDGEILTNVIWRPANADFWWLAPRLHVGGHVSVSGKTNYAYTGLTWTWDELVWTNTFAEVSFGAALNDGYTGNYAPLDRAKMGCTALFRESGSIGFRLTDNWVIMATIDHVSNAGLCGLNRGITNVGGRIGYRF